MMARRIPRLSLPAALALVSLLGLPGCGSSNTCSVTAIIAPKTATAVHSAAAPGNQVQFTLNSTVKGTCPLPADKAGTWSSSDAVNVSISNQAGTSGLATCLGATASPVTITNSGTVGGHPYQSASLACQ